MREISTPIDILDDPNAESGDLAKWILPLILPELNARTFQEKGNQHLLQDNVARLAGNLQAAMSNLAALSEALQTQWQAIAALARGHTELTNDMPRLQALIESVVGGVADVGREQAAVRTAMEDSTQVMRTTAEAIGQGQRTLQIEVEKVVDTTKQTIAALTATAAEQTAVRETVGRVMEEVTGVGAKQTALREAVQAHGQTITAAVTTLAGSHGQLASDVGRLHELTQMVVGGVADVAREQAAVRGAMQDSTQVLRATAEAIGQGQRTLQTEVEQKLQALIEPVVGGIADVAREQAAVRGAMQDNIQVLRTTAEAIGQGQRTLQTEVEQRLQALIEPVVGGIADVAREQAAVRGAMQDNSQVLRATAEAIGQGQRTLQAEVEKVVDTTKQTVAALTATAAEQTAVRETVGRVMEEVTGIGAKQAALSEAARAQEQAITAATTTLAGGQGQLAGDVQRLHELTQMVVGSVADVAREQAAVRGAMQDNTQVLRGTAEAIGQGQRTLQTEVEKIADTTKQTVAALTATAAEQTAVRETVGHVMEEVTGIGAKQAALSEAARAQEQAITAAATTLAGGQGQLASDMRKLQALIEPVVGGIADVAREQAVVRGAVQDSTQVVRTTAEAIGQGQKTLQTEVEKVVDTTKQTIAALTATVAEEAAGHEITRRMIGEVANAAMAALAMGQGRLTGDVPLLQASTQMVGDVGPLEVGPPVPAEEQDSSHKLSAATAITHGEQIRYEVGADRDNLGFWNNASDWAEWELEIARPGRFTVTAEIAALASGRFQVVLADQKLDGSAPNTGDYARFQKVELGTVELTSSGKTRVAVRPIPEGWQPMNLRSLDLAPLT